MFNFDFKVLNIKKIVANQNKKISHRTKLLELNPYIQNYNTMRVTINGSQTKLIQPPILVFLFYCVSMIIGVIFGFIYTTSTFLIGVLHL